MHLRVGDYRFRPRTSVRLQKEIILTNTERLCISLQRIVLTIFSETVREIAIINRCSRAVRFRGRAPELTRAPVGPKLLPGGGTLQESLSPTEHLSEQFPPSDGHSHH